MKPFLIIKTGGTFADYAVTNGDFEDWTARAMGLENGQYEVVNVQAGEPLPSPADYAGCVMTGSHDMVTDKAGWMNRTGLWVAEAVAAGLPLIGICFGHQLMAEVLGGESGFHPDGPEIGTMEIRLTGEAAADPLFSLLPQTFPGHATHSQCALRLPAEAVLLAASDHEPHQAFRFGDCAWGVQFHPEFDAEATRHYVREQKGKILANGDDVEALLKGVRETPESTGLMAKFVEFCRERERKR